MTLRRAFTLSPSDRVLIAEDVVTTGRSQTEALDVARKAGGQVIGVGAIIDRSSTASFGVRFEALASLDARQWKAERCPRCDAGEPLAEPGSRHLTTHRPT